MIVNLFFKTGLSKYLMKSIPVRWATYIESNLEIFKNKVTSIFLFVLFHNKYIHAVYL